MEIISDYLVIGSGIAGLIFAIKASRYGKVIIITKKTQSETNTNYAQGGIATVFSDDDSFKSHIDDTLSAGCGLSHENVVNMVIKNGPRVVKELLELGINFSENNGQLDLGREGGHSKNRIVHTKDYTGFEIEQKLLNRIKNSDNIRILENHMALDLIINDNGICIGVKSLDRENGNIDHYLAKIVLLASGGGARIYKFTTNPTIATGDGIAMSYLKGASVGNMEFVQFHPTSLYEKNPISEKSFLISEAIRGAGAILKTPDGKEFMSKYHEKASLAPRDVVARAIDKEMRMNKYQYALLDLANIHQVEENFPNIMKECKKRDIDISYDMIPVVPAAHYLCGGVKSNLMGKTDIEGLYVAGEVAFTGLHGANRLASNSLLEALVFAENVYKESINKLDKDVKFSYNRDGIMQLVFVNDNMVEGYRVKIRDTMWDMVGIVRNNNRLFKADSIIGDIYMNVSDMINDGKISSQLFEVRNMAITSLLVIRSSIARKESRGLNFNEDYPDIDNSNFKSDTIIKRRNNEKQTGTNGKTF